MIERTQNQNGLTAEMLARNESVVHQWKDDVHAISQRITNILDCEGIEPYNEERLADMQQTVNFIADVNQELSALASRFNVPNAVVAAPEQAGALDAAALVRVVSGLQAHAITPKLQCCKFSGSPTLGKFEYKNFKAQFENCVRHVTSDAVKLAHLRGYLTDTAFDIVSHLTLEDANYELAIELLDEQFLDKPFMLDEIMRQIVNEQPKYDENFTNVKSFMVKLRADLSELNTSFGYDCLEENSFGCALLSHIVFNKLPKSLQKELISRNETNYPNINEVFATYNEAIKTLVKTKIYQIL